MQQINPKKIFWKGIWSNLEISVSIALESVFSDNYS